MIEFDKIPNELKIKGEARAIAQAEYNYYNGLTKNILSGIASTFEGGESTRRRLAEATEDYKNQLLLVKEKEESFRKLLAEEHALNSRFDYYRTVNANERANTRLI